MSGCRAAGRAKTGDGFFIFQAPAGTWSRKPTTDSVRSPSRATKSVPFKRGSCPTGPFKRSPREGGRPGMTVVS